MSGGFDEDEHEEHENHEAWVIPYADMLTLLMALFLVLFAMGRVDLERFEALASSLGSELNPMASGGGGGGVGGGGDGVLPGDDGGTAAEAGDDGAGSGPGDGSGGGYAGPAEFEDIEAEIASEAAEQGVGDGLRFRVDDRGLVITILSDRILFPSGSADLAAEGVTVLDSVAAALGDFDNDVVVEGHTDEQPIRTARYPSNWELSTARASAVLRQLIERNGLDPKRLSAAGYADQQPVDDGHDAEARAHNRRVELVVVSAEPMADGTAAGEDR